MLREKNWIISVTASQTSAMSTTVEDHCLQAMQIVHHHANSHFDQSVSEHQSVTPSREVVSILSGKYKRFTFVHPVQVATAKIGIICATAIHNAAKVHPNYCITFLNYCQLF